MVSRSVTDKRKSTRKAAKAKPVGAKAANVASKPTKSRDDVPTSKSALTPVTSARDTLKHFALTLPEAYEDFPWGESVIKVRKKVFVFLGRAASDALSMSVKLPETGEDVRALPFATPTGYGLGKSGWVTITFDAAEIPPADVMAGWIVESYRAVAPKKLVATLVLGS